MPLFVSVSDTKSRWAMLAADRPCGLDVEENSRNLTVATAKKLHPLEQQYLSGLEPLGSEWRSEFLNIWVRKEAYMKFCGEGLRMGLSKFSVLDEQLNYADYDWDGDKRAETVIIVFAGYGGNEDEDVVKNLKGW